MLKTIVPAQSVIAKSRSQHLKTIDQVIQKLSGSSATAAGAWQPRSTDQTLAR